LLHSVADHRCLQKRGQQSSVTASIDYFDKMNRNSKTSHKNLAGCGKARDFSRLFCLLFCLGILSKSSAIFAFIFRADLSPKKANNKLPHIHDVVKLTCHVGGDRDSLDQRQLPLCPCGHSPVTQQICVKRPSSKGTALFNTPNTV
jgi:hypothetical protein